MKKLLLILVCVFVTYSNVYAASSKVKNVQYLLNQLGFNAGKEDGLYGNTTKKALIAFYESQGRLFDGSINQNEISDLIFIDICFDFSVEYTPLRKHPFERRFS